MISLRRYTASDSRQWDDFVEDSRNGTFLFMRGYMDYHSDRFRDHSLMYFNEKGKLLALLPANDADGVLYSHRGLTYGGFVTSCDTRMVTMMEQFDVTLEYLKANGFSKWYYKQIPTCYHCCPAEEDEYALWRHGAQLEQCLISTAIPLNGFNVYPEVERRRKRGQRKAIEHGCTVEESDDIEAFWPIMQKNLSDRYAVKPVHSVTEMRLLKDRFPNNIKCFLVKRQETVIAGCIVYIANSQCVHIQYGHSSLEGKEYGALDLLYLTLIDRYRGEGFRFLDFGNSNEDGGRYLNENLMAQKEGFGGRGMAYKQWCLDI